MARKLLIRREKKIVEQGKEIVIAKQRMYYVADCTKDFHSTDGVFPKKELAKKDGSSTGPKNDFIILSSCFIDDYRRIARLAQIIPLKDLGVIIATTGINKTSKAVDAGAGSGALACMLAHICKQVTTYDIRDDCLDIAKKNKEFLNLKNLKITNKDVYAGIDEKNLDPIPLHLRNASNKLMRSLGFGQGHVRYPWLVEKQTGKKIEQEYMPKNLKGRKYYIIDWK